MIGSALAAAVLAATAVYPMTEGPTDTVMRDAVGNHDGVIGSKVVRKGEFFRFRKVPYGSPLDVERTIRIPDAAALDPGDGVYSVRWRQRTTHTLNGQNVVQKGQGSPPGGMFKFKNGMNGKDYMRVSCFWRGSDGGAFVESPPGMDFRDGKWHRINCTTTGDRVTMRVDGRLVDSDAGPGTIANTWPLVIGGNITGCDDVGDDERHCNYWAGDLDWLKVVTS